MAISEKKNSCFSTKTFAAIKMGLLHKTEMESLFFASQESPDRQPDVTADRK